MRGSIPVRAGPSACTIPTVAHGRFIPTAAGRWCPAVAGVQRTVPVPGPCPAPPFVACAGSGHKRGSVRPSPVYERPGRHARLGALVWVGARPCGRLGGVFGPLVDRVSSLIPRQVRVFVSSLGGPRGPLSLFCRGPRSPRTVPSRARRLGLPATRWRGVCAASCPRR